MTSSLEARLGAEIESFKRDGVYKRMNFLESPQGSRVRMEGRGEVVVLSSNNYLGLCNVPEVVAAGKRGLDELGAGTASVRFICGTFTIHRRLEETLARFLGTEAALSYVSCWNANTGLMPTFLDEQDVIISDALNHASIIDGMRLCKAPRKIYPHSDMAALEAALKESAGSRTRLVMTDGVFSMEGDIARLPDIIELARKYDAVVAVDDSHSTGVLGKTGKGTFEHYGLGGRDVDIITSTLGKALGGAAGGFTAGPATIVDYLVQRSRPQLFSNALPPTVAYSSLAAVEYLAAHPERVQRLRDNTKYFRERIQALGLNPRAGETPIVPIIVGETAFAIRMSEMMLREGVFVTGFGYPVVPKGEARIRCQISAGHTREDLDKALDAFKKVGREMGLIS
ncbi:MAG: glycine C-acetyltransferase [Planctomycetes bacterium]|nr:glycine C-acetyltransferase [Planctomycetota bacterium]